MTEDPDSQGAGLELPPGKRTRERLAGTPGGHRVKSLSLIPRKILIGIIGQVVYKKPCNDHKMPM